MTSCTPDVTRRRFLSSLTVTVGILSVKTERVVAGQLQPFRLPEPIPHVVDQVTPKAGVPTGIAFKDSIQKIVAAGVLDPRKFRASVKELPAWVERLLLAHSDDRIVFTAATAPYLLDLLWPIGLSNRPMFNDDSPINTVNIPSYASTGGWALGRQRGHVYFNQVEGVRMTGHQEAMVFAVARDTYRPCCNNSTLFQDCNHGSALLGWLELAASQGATLKGLYALALTANSYWFPDNYAKTALYFSHFHRTSWHDIDPKLILSAAYSSGSGWEANVNSRLRRANVTLPGMSNAQQGC